MQTDTEMCLYVSEALAFQRQAQWSRQENTEELKQHMTRVGGAKWVKSSTPFPVLMKHPYFSGPRRVVLSPTSTMASLGGV